MLLDWDANKHGRPISESTLIAILSASYGGISQLFGLITLLKFQSSYCNFLVVRHFRTFMVTSAGGGGGGGSFRSGKTPTRAVQPQPKTDIARDFKF